MEKETVWALVFEARKEAFAKGYPLFLPIKGWSMFPLLVNGDTIQVVKTDPAKLRPGDVVVFDAKELVAHRLLRIRRKKEARFFVTKGDTLAYSDGLVAEKAIVGKVVRVRKPWFCLSLEGPAGRLLNLTCLALSETRFWTPGLVLFGKMVRCLRRI